MRSKIFIRLSPKVKFPLDLSFLNFRKGTQGIVDIINLVNICLIFTFIIAAMSLEFFAVSAGSNLIVLLYAILLILLGLYLIKLALCKLDVLNQIPFDIPILTFTTIIAFSLFMGTAVLQNTSNIWGGTDLRMLSGVTLIAFWFLYYLLVSALNSKKLFKRSLIAFWLAPLFALLCWLLTFSDFIMGQKIVLALMLPATVWLVLTQSKNTWLHFVNLLISLLILITANDRIVIFIDILVFFISFIVVIISQRNKLAEKFRGLDELPKTKYQILGYIRKNSVPFYLIFSAIAIVAGIFWMKAYYKADFFGAITLGIKSLAFNNSSSLLLGNGLNVIAASTILKFVNVYGIIPCLTLAVSFFFIVRDLIKTYKKTTSQSNKGIIIWILTFAFSLISYLAISISNSETVLLLLLLLLLFAGLLKRLLMDKSYTYSEPELRTFDKKGRKPAVKILLRIIQIILIILIILAAIYLLCSLNYINIFLMSN